MLKVKIGWRERYVRKINIPPTIEEELVAPPPSPEETTLQARIHDLISDKEVTEIFNWENFIKDQEKKEKQI